MNQVPEKKPSLDDISLNRGRLKALCKLTHTETGIHLAISTDIDQKQLELAAERVEVDSSDLQLTTIVRTGLSVVLGKHSFLSQLLDKTASKVERGFTTSAIINGSEVNLRRLNIVSGTYDTVGLEQDAAILAMLNIIATEAKIQLPENLYLISIVVEAETGKNAALLEANKQLNLDAISERAGTGRVGVIFPSFNAKNDLDSAAHELLHRIDPFSADRTLGMHEAFTVFFSSFMHKDPFLYILASHVSHLDLLENILSTESEIDEYLNFHHAYNDPVLKYMLPALSYAQIYEQYGMEAVMDFHLYLGGVIPEKVKDQQGIINRELLANYIRAENVTPKEALAYVSKRYTGTVPNTLWEDFTKELHIAILECIRTLRNS